MIDWDEVRAALAATRPYVLSHHEPEEWDRCYAPSVGSHRVRLCARCLGIYPGIVAGIVASLLASPLPTGLWVVAGLPLPALVDWTATAFTDRSGWNSVRTATGVLLGYAYAVGLGLVLGDMDLRVILVGIGYGAVATTLLYYHRTGRFSTASEG